MVRDEGWSPLSLKTRPERKKMFDLYTGSLEPQEKELEVECSLCGHREEYELSDEEAQTLQRYRVQGRSMGYIQDLFPKVPAWIRSGAIDACSGGFCICPKCSGF